MAFQYPVEIPGVRPFQFLKAALDSRADATGQKKLSAREFTKRFDEKVVQVGINANLIKRSLNEGFSGGEKKRNEILQLEILQPVLAIMDETDSGLDVDALKIVAEGVNSQRSPDRSFLRVTHYQRLLNYIKPDRVHILVDGKIVETGGPELAVKVEKSGYKEYLT
jgi:Fe-S cluster assembly ATP-binding protein